MKTRVSKSCNKTTIVFVQSKVKFFSDVINPEMANGWLLSFINVLILSNFEELIN